MKKILISALLAASLGSVHATVFQFTVNFSSAGESLPSTGTGFGTVAYDDISHTLAVFCSFTNLQGNTTASHIHAPTTAPFTGSAGVATTTPTFAGFPLGVTFGTYTNFLDLTLSSSWNPAFVTANSGSLSIAEETLANAMKGGEAYWNIHSSFDPPGEIRGFLTNVPEPGTLSLVSLGGAALLMVSRRRKRVAGR